MKRPYPPIEITEGMPGLFVPAPALWNWALMTFVAETATFPNPDHEHLRSANVAFAWTNEPNARAGRTVLGQCELMPPMAMGKWARARAAAQMRDWFDEVPDFLITIDGTIAATMDDASFMALIEHELYHAGQARDEFGMPKFNKQTGLPVWAIRGHDVEEFVGVVRRYGAAAAGVEELVRAANKGPEIAHADILKACGNCLRLVKA